MFESNGEIPNNTVNFNIRPQYKLSNQAKLVSSNAYCSENINESKKKRTDELSTLSRKCCADKLGQAIKKIPALYRSQKFIIALT
jgi:hypothetical protein